MLMIPLLLPPKNLPTQTSKGQVLRLTMGLCLFVLLWLWPAAAIASVATNNKRHMPAVRGQRSAVVFSTITGKES